MCQVGGRTWQCRPHGTDLRIMTDTVVEGEESLPPWLRRAAEAKHMAGKSPCGSLEGPLPEAGKVEPGLYWRP